MRTRWDTLPSGLWSTLHSQSERDLTEKPLLKLIERLNSLGFSWQDIARISGVSMPALRKWRHGHSPTGINRQRVAMVVAFCRIAKEKYLIEDVAGWLESPLHPSAPITGLDLVAEERCDLALELVSTGLQDPESVLDRFDPGWKDRYGSQVEVFAAPDGLPGLRLTCSYPSKVQGTVGARTTGRQPGRRTHM